MRRGTLLALAAAAALPARAAGYLPGKLLCQFQDQEIRESSGIASSSRSDRFFFTHNDSGDEARFFAVSTRGRTLATFEVEGAKNVDWEDMARTRDEAGRAVLLLGDIGDNAAARSGIRLYQVREPKVDPDRPAGKRKVAAEAFTLQYPDGPRDAETLLADPGGRVYLVSKNAVGSGVYAAPHPLSPEKPNRLKRIGSLSFLLLPGRGGSSLGAQARRLLATGGAISPDGRRLVIRTYSDAYEWDLPNGDLAAALKRKPRRILLPQMRQGEAITYTRDGKALLTSSEGQKAPVYRLRPQP